MEPTEVEAVRRALHALEPLFHREPAGAGRAHFAKMVVPDFWEVGASGNLYELETVLNTLEERPRKAGDDCWRVDGFEVRILAPGVWLATYVLQQGPRRTRRATVWRWDDGRWLAVYHQGTLV